MLRGVLVSGPLSEPSVQIIDRATDLAATVVGGLVVLPLIGALALLVWVESPRGGPIFYRDHRQDDRLFSRAKFLTMVPDAEARLWRLLEDDADARGKYFRFQSPRTTRA